MKRILVSLVWFVFTLAQAGTQLVSLDDLLLLIERRVSDETILVLLETREIGFTPGAEEIDRLLEAGISEEVIRYLLRKTEKATDPAYTYRYSRTYVEPYPAYYFTPYYYGGSAFLGFSTIPHAWLRHHQRLVSHPFAHHDTLQHATPHHVTVSRPLLLPHAIQHGSLATDPANRHGLGAQA